jgi:hypothetical protein
MEIHKNLNDDQIVRLDFIAMKMAKGEYNDDIVAKEV